MVKLSQWAVINHEDADPWQAPEQRGLCLTGYVEGHPSPRISDGDHIVTSVVDKFLGRLVVTMSGTKYFLEEPSEEYREWLRENRPDWDPEQPFKHIG